MWRVVQSGRMAVVNGSPVKLNQSVTTVALLQSPISSAVVRQPTTPGSDRYARLISNNNLSCWFTCSALTLLVGWKSGDIDFRFLFNWAVFPDITPD